MLVRHGGWHQARSLEADGQDERDPDYTMRQCSADDRLLQLVRGRELEYAR